mmetsp:Transcript_20189/g.43875  ORF Transcript_20189/g.43875 Transcript_20189/m.43875 type:complete len:113 (-) Transcript_20189:342-680(-)
MEQQYHPHLSTSRQLPSPQQQSSPSSSNQQEHSQQQHEQSSSYRHSSFVMSLLLSFTLGSVVLLAATLFMHSNVIVEIVEEVHSTMFDYLQLVHYLKSRSLGRRLTKRYSSL